MKLLSNTLTAFAFCLLGWAAAATADQGPRILAIGDSLMASHSISGRSIPHAVSRSLGEPVVNRSVVGARMLYKLPITGAMGLNISKQFRRGKKFDWVIINGGGNDLWFGCGCARCDRKINKLISKDGRRGEIPKLVARVRKTGARVIYIGYLRTPGVRSPIEHCSDDGHELEGRIARMAKLDRGITFLSLAKLVPNGDRSYHMVDMIHPSLKASATIGRMVAEIIRR